jgi:hypothetical protein
LRDAICLGKKSDEKRSRGARLRARSHANWRATRRRAAIRSAFKRILNNLPSKRQKGIANKLNGVFPDVANSTPRETSQREFEMEIAS